MSAALSPSEGVAGKIAQNAVKLSLTSVFSLFYEIEKRPDGNRIFFPKDRYLAPV
jgi:hypothetical protein